jgi:hypothetical protein
VLRTRQDQITKRDGETYLILDRHGLVIPPRLAVLLRQLPKPRGASTLPPNRPRRSSCSLAGHSASPSLPARSAGDSKKHGVMVRGGRNTALIGQHRRSARAGCWPTCSA